MTHFNHPPLSGGSLNTGKETRKAYKTRMSGTFRKNTLWINTLWKNRLKKNTLECFKNVEILKFGQKLEIWSKF